MLKQVTSPNPLATITNRNTETIGACVRHPPKALPVVLTRGCPPRQNRRVPTLALYPFRFRDPLTRQWVRARHKMQVPEMQRQYAEWEVTGAPQIRYVTDAGVQPFSPYGPPAPPALTVPWLARQPALTNG
jgi:hypothetical protein